MLTQLTQQLFAELKKRLPDSLPALPEQELKAALRSAISKLDLAPRDEFDAQQAVLQRTRQRLEALEQRLAELEAQFQKR